MNSTDLARISAIVENLCAENNARMAAVANEPGLTPKAKKDAKANLEWYQAGVDELYAQIRAMILKGGL